jgi:signal transduction histidine kinase
LITQVFSNIIENAVKYANANTVIKIDGTYDRQTESVRVTVASKGIPLNKEDQARVFVRGFRSPEAKRKHPAGTGFGLYIARRIVEIHGGSVSAKNLGGWTTFEVTLPVRGPGMAC